MKDDKLRCNGKEILETRITCIRKTVRLEQQENWAFRSMLKASGMPVKEIDTVASQIYTELKDRIDCTSCAYCCKNITPIISEADIKRIAKYLKISVSNAKKLWVKRDRDMGMIFKSRPCPFLESKKCSIYPARPNDCRSYPHLHRKNIIRYFTSIYAHMDLCPLVFHFYNNMKKKLVKKLDPKKITWK